MKILGVDPGSRTIGLAIILKEREKIRYVTSHTLKIKKGELPSKLSYILEQFKEYILKYKPDMVSIEDHFYHKNPKVLLLLGRISGVLIAQSSRMGLPVSLYSPSEMKKSITGTGGASKEQVAYMVKKILNLKGEAPMDATDAIGIALCHCFLGKEF